MLLKYRSDLEASIQHDSDTDYVEAVLKHVRTCLRDLADQYDFLGEYVALDVRLQQFEQQSRNDFLRRVCEATRYLNVLHALFQRAALDQEPFSRGDFIGALDIYAFYVEEIARGK